MAVTGAAVKPAWVVASLTAYWQDELMSTSTQRGQLLTAPFGKVVVVWRAGVPPVKEYQYRVPGLEGPLLKNLSTYPLPVDGLYPKTMPPKVDPSMGWHMDT